MKNLLIVAFLTIVQGVYSQDTVSVNGTLYNSSMLSTPVHLYETDTTGKWQKDTVMYFINVYKIEVESNEAYLIRFEDPKGDKMLWLDLSEPSGFYTMNVNFDLTTHGVIYYDIEFQKYVSYLISNEQVKELFGLD